MKNKTKVIILGSVLILTIVIISFNISGYTSGEVNSNYPHSWTKAICNETQCQDYQIFCNGNELINKTAITGAVISIPKDWEDPRNKTMKDRECD
jgi:hypothetical protein